MNVPASLVVVTGLVLLTACSSPQYILSTTEGNMIVTTGKPRLDDKAGIYTYEDADGKSTTIPKANVVQIMER